MAKENFEFDSSNLDTGYYDSETKVLGITFKRSGETYEYQNVPRETVDNLISSKSQGKFFYGNIQKRFKYKKL